MEFKSQIGQDRWVCEFFSYKKNGYFVDIGAHNGIFYSNTIYLEQVLGWKGICMEAGLGHYNSLLRNRSCDSYHAFITNQDGENISFNESNYVKPRIRKTIKVPTRTVATAFKSFAVPKVIDYVSLDVDGPEYKILQGFPFTEHEVILWTIEHNMYQTGPESKMNIKGIMEANGYVIAKEDMSSPEVAFEDWYVNKKYI